LTETPWIDALDIAAGRLAYVKKKYGAQAIAGLITARCTNEDLYVFQKFMRTVIGTNNLDSSARYGHINFVRAIRHSLDLRRSMNTSEEITKAKAILLVGSNITETNPVASLRVKAAISVYKAQTIVVDSSQTNIAKLASHPMMVKPGTEGLFVQVLVKSVIQQDLVDEETTQQHPEAFASLKQAVEEISLDQISKQTGVEIYQIQEVAKIFAEATRSIILCGEGIVRHAGGYQNVLNLIDLAWVTGKLGRPGCGISTLTEEANEQGALDMGVAPEFLPGLSSVNDPAAREKFSSAWGTELPEPRSDHTLMDIFERCRTGEIKALYIVGENPLATLPASFDVETALNNLEVLICQDPFMTETAKLAHVVFPACTFAEKDGTVTNQEGKVQYLRPAFDPLGESAVDWHIMVGLANGLDSPMEFETTHDIQKEIMKLLPGYYNLGQVKRVEPHPEGYLANGFATSVQSRYACPPNGQPDRSFGLRMTQLLYHSGKLSTHASGLVEISPNTKRLRMIPEDMERLGLRPGDQVRMTSEQGTLELPVQADLSVMPGSCAFPEHFNDPPVKDLIPLQVDPDTGVPYFKLVRVTLEKI
jgi:formate dehydrogenase alpha subunit